MSLIQLARAYPNEQVVATADNLTLSGCSDSQTEAIEIPICSDTHLPFGTAIRKRKPCSTSLVAANDTTPLQVNARRSKKEPDLKLTPSSSLTEGANFNLSEPEKELLRWHYRLGHVSIRRVQWLFQQGLLSHTERTRRLHAAAAKLITGPMCTACQYAKQRRKTSPGTVKRNVPSEEGALKSERLFPGQQVSVDHFVSNPKGRLLTTYGKEADSQRYCGGCIFVDHATSFVHIELQTHLNSHETLKAKKSFEALCAANGVVVQEYLSDNGTAFLNADYTKHLEQFHQTARHAGVGAHHSNGIAERSISTVMSIARAMMHHSAIHWPDVVDVHLWPLAVTHAERLLNTIPREDSGQSAQELFSRVIMPRSKLHEFHVWGCPCYVLHHALSNGKKLPRWKPRSGRHQYMGASNDHSSSIPLVLSLDTGKITPQYHVMFDNWFQTVSATDAAQPNFDHDDWYNTFGSTDLQYIPDGAALNGPSEGAQDTTLERELTIKREDMARVREAAIPPQPLDNVQLPPVPNQGPSPKREPTVSYDPPAPREPAVPTGTSPQREEGQNKMDQPGSVHAKTQHSESAKTGWFDVEEAPPRPERKPAWFDVEEAPPRPERTISNPHYPIRTRSQTAKEGTMLVRETNPKTFSAFLERADSMSHTQVCTSLKQIEPGHPVLDPLMAFWCRLADANLSAVYKSKAKSDPDTLNWDQAMTSPYREEFLKAADEEIAALEKQGTWIEDLIDNAQRKVVPSQWVFRIKRTPDGEVKKFKARLVLRGDLQEYDGETFSPVASWATVRSFLVISAVMKRVTCTIDFSNAFVQSPLPEDEPVWMHTPRGYRSTNGTGRCLQLKKSLYGHAVAPLLWYKYISKYFKKLGLKQSEFDPCLWYKKDLMLVQYVDDMGLSAPNQDVIDQFVTDLRKEGLVLTQDESFSEFLGIKFEELKDGSINMTQKGLINKILTAAKMTDCNPNATPAAQNPLGKNEDDQPMQEVWSYRGIVGMLLYLSTNTRPDIAYAVSQVARFSAEPKKSHATAVKTILRYLKKTSDKGTQVKPTKHLHLDLYVDADFAGLFKFENDRDPNSVRSRTGYVISLSNWPLLWKSQLQTHLSQSTLEAEYSALSYSLKTFLPLKRLIEEMVKEIEHTPLEDATVRATVFEDNQGAFYLATNHRITNRTKYFLTKWHWFWQQYDDGNFKIEKCPTDEQRADFLTKALPREKFEANRLAVLGW